MATVDSLTRGTLTALTQNTVNSGTVYEISGLLDDERFGLGVMASGAAGTSVVIYSGDYQNAGVGDYTLTAAMAANQLYVVQGLEGARYRKNDGTIDVTFNMPTGIAYFWTY